VPKFTQRYLKPTQFKPKGSMFEGLVWSVPGSKPGTSYAVELHDKGFTCECSGFTFRGKCKHSESVNKRIEEALDGRVPQYKWV
jgi:hypothetical protein